MRLVDLDDDAHVFCGEDGEYQKWNIDISKTIGAVPVGFIFDKMSTIYSEYINIQRHIDTEPETVERRIGIATNLLREYNTLRNLIREWEGNENGSNN